MNCYDCEVVDLPSAIKRLQAELRTIQNDLLKNAHISFDTETEEYKKATAKRMERGVMLCDIYLTECISLEQFCEEMTDIDLTPYMFNVADFIPRPLVIKYGLTDENITLYDDEQFDEYEFEM